MLQKNQYIIAKGTKFVIDNANFPQSLTKTCLIIKTFTVMNIMYIYWAKMGNKNHIYQQTMLVWVDVLEGQRAN